MVEAGKWMVNPSESKIAHVTIGLNIPDPHGPRRSACGLYEIDSTWKPWEGHEERCKTCLDIIETAHLSRIERFNEINRRRLERAKNVERDEHHMTEDEIDEKLKEELEKIFKKEFGPIENMVDAEYIARYLDGEQPCREVLEMVSEILSQVQTHLVSLSELGVSSAQILFYIIIVQHYFAALKLVNDVDNTINVHLQKTIRSIKEQM